MSQIQRILAELGVTSIPAHSPQAKGRIERLFETLQDRLTKEMRLADIRTEDEANAFLSGFLTRHNDRFAIAPKDPTPAWIPLPSDLDRNYYVAIRQTRTVRADHCISWLGQTLQLLPDRREPQPGKTHRERSHRARRNLSCMMAPGRSPSSGDRMSQPNLRTIYHSQITTVAPNESLSKDGAPNAPALRSSLTLGRRHAWRPPRTKSLSQLADIFPEQ